MFSPLSNINGTSIKEIALIDPMVARYSTEHIMCVAVAFALCIPLAI